jgi:hypothetical protein
VDTGIRRRLDRLLGGQVDEISGVLRVIGSQPKTMFNVGAHYVETVRLDSYIDANEFERVFFLKTDVQGRKLDRLRPKPQLVL